tara:strand:- start:3291 stop:3869 length:579 start_codon:yes stop_codon:yes gene_type:complete
MTNEQWKKIQDKYQRLIYTIAYRIGGDEVAHDFDDNVQELCITAMDAVKAFQKKTGKEFDEFFDTLDFHKYIKTCLWNKKNNVGNKIKKKYGIRNCVSLSANPDMFSTHTGAVYGSSSLEVKDATEDFAYDVDLDDHQREILKNVLGDFRLIKPDGKLNISKLSRITNTTKAQVRRSIKNMRHKLKDYNEAI